MKNTLTEREVVRDKTHTRLEILFGVLILIAITVLSYLGLDRIKEQARTDLADSLQTTLHITNAALHGWIHDREDDAAHYVQRPDFQRELKKLLKLPRKKDLLLKASAQKNINKLLLPYIEEYSNLGFFIVSPDRITIASSHSPCIGEKNILISHGNYLDKVFAGTPELIPPLPPEKKLPKYYKDMMADKVALFLVVPIFDKKDKVIAVLGLLVDPNFQFANILRLTWSKKTGETFAFDKNGYIVTQSRFEEDLVKAGILKANESSVMNLKLKDPGTNIIKKSTEVGTTSIDRPFIKSVQDAVGGGTGSDVLGYRDYRGVSVVGAWRWNKELNMGIAIQSEITEAYNSYYATRRIIILLLIVTILLYTVLSISLIKKNNEVLEKNKELHDEAIELEEMRKELEVLVITDPLTGAFNRLKFEEVIMTEVERIKRYDHKLSLIVFDMDNFKKINDKYGHLAGDHALKTAAKITRSRIRDIDSFVRMGGEEFLIVIPETDLEGAKKIAERIRADLENYNFKKFSSVTASFGVAEYIDGEKKDDFIKRADDALYQAKKNGRNRIEVAT